MKTGKNKLLHAVAAKNYEIPGITKIYPAGVEGIVVFVDVKSGKCIVSFGAGWEAEVDATTLESPWKEPEHKEVA